MKKTKTVAKKYLRTFLVYGLLMLPLAYLSDCVLGAILFGHGTLSEQFFAPSNQVLAIRLLFGVFILAVTSLGASLLAKTARVEMLLRSRNEDLLLANQELEEFSFTLSHDLRNMLTRMYASAGLLKEQCQHIDDERVRFLIENISVSSDQMETQVEALLNLATIASGDLNRTDLYLDELARDITDSLMAVQAHGRITLNITPKMHDNCDAKLLRLALKSLFSNALKFIPNNRQGVITFSRIKRQGETVYFVQDNGIGFDSELADKIFDVYRQPSATDELPGSGIGLATVRRVIQRHGGRVWAEGVPDAGATFYFTLKPKP